MYFVSTDSGETFGAQQFDDSISLDPTCQGSVISATGSDGSPRLLLSGTHK